MNNGNFETRDTGLSGYPSRLRFEWWLIEQDVASNRSRIGFKLFGVGGTVTGAWTRMFSAYANVAGQLWETGGHNLYNGTIVIQGEKWVNHDSAGGCFFEVSADAAIYQNAKNSLARLAGICQPFQELHSRLLLPTRTIRRILTLVKLSRFT